MCTTILHGGAAAHGYPVRILFTDRGFGVGGAGRVRFGGVGVGAGGCGCPGDGFVSGDMTVTAFSANFFPFFLTKDFTEKGVTDLSPVTNEG